MGLPDFTSPSLDYESDDYYDEEGRRVQERDYASYPSNGGRHYVPVDDSDFTVDDPDCGSFQLMESKEIEKEEEPEPILMDGEGPAFDIDAEYVPSKDGPPQVDLPPRPVYTLSDMTPTVRDPRCTSKDQQLACLWPVYVGNFRLVKRNYNESEFKYVAEYFAWKGLHARWFFRKFDKYYTDFQSKANLFDMLVYFVSEQDAKRAIQLCHRDMYKGYPINVFPGREPVYFDPTRSLHAKNMKSGRVYSELFFEKRVKFVRNVNPTCTVKFDMFNGAMEFATAADAAKARKTEKLWKFEPVPANLQKQRYVESDVLEDIRTWMAQHPGMLDFQPNKDPYVELLLKNKRPEVDPNPSGPVVPLRRGPTKGTQMRRFDKKQEENQRRIEKHLLEGRQPKCYTNTKNGKRLFREMVEKAKAKHGL